jgi:alpha-beta hydrolase superfamily lysophospholipase
LSRDTTVVDAFINDPLCFAELQPAAFASFLGAAPRLADPIGLRRIRHDLPIYLFSGDKDPVGQRLEGVQILIERYHDAGIDNISHDFYPGGRHEMLKKPMRIGRDRKFATKPARQTPATTQMTPTRCLLLRPARMSLSCACGKAFIQALPHTH